MCVLNGWLQVNVVEYFLCIGSAKYTRASPPARKMSLFSAIVITIMLSLLRSMSQEANIIWLSFVTDKCKMKISLGVLFIFSKCWFFWLLGGAKGKKKLKMTKNSARHTLYLRNHTSYDLNLLYTCEKG